MSAMTRISVAVVVSVAVFSCVAASRDSGGDRARELAQACAGLDDVEVADAIAAIRPNIEAVQTKYETMSYPKGSPAQRLDGALIYVRATQGASAPWLTRVLSCHALRHAPALCAAHDRCPLALEGTRVSTTETATGFAIAIEAKDRAVVDEIVRRSRELAPAASPR